MATKTRGAAQHHVQGRPSHGFSSNGARMPARRRHPLFEVYPTCLEPLLGVQNAPQGRLRSLKTGYLSRPKAVVPLPAYLISPQRWGMVVICDMALGGPRHRVMWQRGVRVNTFCIEFSDGTRQVLGDLSQRLDTSVAEVIRESLSLYTWVVRERSAGSRLLVQRGEEVTELVIPSLERLTKSMADSAEETAGPP